MPAALCDSPTIMGSPYARDPNPDAPGTALQGDSGGGVFQTAPDGTWVLTGQTKLAGYNEDRKQSASVMLDMGSKDYQQYLEHLQQQGAMLDFYPSQD